MSRLTFKNNTYISNVKDILEFIGGLNKTTTQIESQFPSILNIEQILKKGLKQGWLCRTQILPDIWRIQRNMLTLNPANKIISTNITDFINVPPNKSVLQIGGKHPPIDNQCKNLCKNFE